MRSAAGCSSRRIAVALLALATLFVSPGVRAGTPYEAQIGGFMSASLQTIITGEFAGRSPSNADAVATRRICRPSDYDDLREAANNSAAFDAFRQRCRLIEFTVGVSQVYAVAHLPHGYCEKLRDVFDRMMAEHIHAPPPRAGDLVVFEYKGSRLEGTLRALARGAQLRSSCREDGFLIISGPRKRPR